MRIFLETERLVLRKFTEDDAVKRERETQIVSVTIGKVSLGEILTKRKKLYTLLSVRSKLN